MVQVSGRRCRVLVLPAGPGAECFAGVGMPIAAPWRRRCGVLWLGCWCGGCVPGRCRGALAWLSSARLLPKMAALPRPQCAAPCGDKAGGRTGLGAERWLWGHWGRVGCGGCGGPAWAPAELGSPPGPPRHPSGDEAPSLAEWWVTSPSPAWRQRWVDEAAPPRYGVSQHGHHSALLALGWSVGCRHLLSARGRPTWGGGAGASVPPTARLHLRQPRPPPPAGRLAPCPRCLPGAGGREGLASRGGSAGRQGVPGAAVGSAHIPVAPLRPHGGPMAAP